MAKTLQNNFVKEIINENKQEIITSKTFYCITKKRQNNILIYEGWNFNSGNYLFTTDTK